MDDGFSYPIIYLLLKLSLKILSCCIDQARATSRSLGFRTRGFTLSVMGNENNFGRQSEELQTRQLQTRVLVQRRIAGRESISEGTDCSFLQVKARMGEKCFTIKVAVIYSWFWFGWFGFHFRGLTSSVQDWNFPAPLPSVSGRSSDTSSLG